MTHSLYIVRFGTGEIGLAEMDEQNESVLRFLDCDGCELAPDASQRMFSDPDWTLGEFLDNFDPDDGGAIHRLTERVSCQACHAFVYKPLARRCGDGWIGKKCCHLGRLRALVYELGSVHTRATQLSNYALRKPTAMKKSDGAMRELSSLVADLEITLHQARSLRDDLGRERARP